MKRAVVLTLWLSGAWRASAGDEAWLSPHVAAPEMRDGARRVERRTGIGSGVESKVAGTGVESPGGSWLRSTLALAAVLGIIGLAAIGSKRWVSPRIGTKTGLIDVLGRVQVAGKQSLLLVRVGPQAVLVGMSQDRMTALSVIEDERVVASLAGQAIGGIEKFREALALKESEYEEDETAAEEVGEESAAGRLSQLRRRLSGTVEKMEARPR